MTKLTIREGAIRALLTAAPNAKKQAALDLKAAWDAGQICLAGNQPAMPDRPARPEKPILIPASSMPKRGKAGAAHKRFAMLHALAHIEFNAIDLAIDVAGRWGSKMPAEFTADWLRIAAEEAVHFGLLQELLAECGGAYGDLPAHDGLWESAERTSHDLAARLVIVPQVLEARGLDVTPVMIAKFEQAGDTAVVQVLTRILHDEVSHVEAGNKWFRILCDESGQAPVEAFHNLVRTYFRGPLKPPFNNSARTQAGLTSDWYEPLGLD